MSDWPLEPDPAHLESLTRAVVDFVLEQVESLPLQPSFDLDGVEAVRATFREPPPVEGRSIEGLLERLRPAIAKSYNAAGPGYLAYIPGGGVYAAALAALLASATNRYVGVTSPAPALVQIEQTVTRWLCDWMGFPAKAQGLLTSGGSLSNFSAVVAARHERLGEDLEGARLYCSEETHYCVAKAARLAGLPRSALRQLPTDDRFRLRPEALAQAIREDRAGGRRPFLVVANVGTTNTGAVDPLPEVLEVAREHGLWVHADAAYGGFFRLAPGGAELLRGIEECDSVTLDPHKGLFLPYGIGALLVRDGAALARAHRESAHYVQDVIEEGSLGFADLSPELSRDFRGLRVWLPIQLHGLEAFRQQAAEKLRLARWAYEQLAADPLFEVIDPPQLSVVAFRLRRAEAEAERLGPELLRRVNDRRRVFLSSTRLRGRYALRICVLSFRTHQDRVEDAVTALRQEARALLGR
ncbi:MAG TPA: aminotransferase class V-fold PLP-dependent enzyme [Vicinamibacteria bacterium]|nr:aminotransferase class V-fold PLP-dependent enzyme [Vicinamibacteria bacterium]